MIDDRLNKILWAVVESYISNPDPVGSRFVTKKYAFGLSPATVRNIMADLEDMGFLHQPHTSAGRVPTDKGYRFYVDALFRKEEELCIGCPDEAYERLGEIRDDINRLLDEATRTLSAHSHYLGIALSPKPEKAIPVKISLFRHRDDHVVVTLMTDEGIIRNKVIHLDRKLSIRDLERVSEYLNSRFVGRTLDEIRSAILREMLHDKAVCDDLIAEAIRVCQEELYFGGSEVFISGLSEVLCLPDFSDLIRIREISKAIEDKHLIIKLLDSMTDIDGVNVLIGSENPAEGMKKLSLVVSTYKEGDRPIGTIGIIGPTRMDYVKAINIVDTTAKFITKMLSEK